MDTDRERRKAADAGLRMNEGGMSSVVMVCVGLDQCSSVFISGSDFFA